MRSELGLANVLRTQHLRSSILESENGAKQKRAQTIQPCLQSFVSDVERTVSRSHITDPYQKNIYQSPNAQASKAKQFAQTLSPLAQIKPIRPKTTERNATERHERKDKDAIRAHILFQKDILRWSKHL